MAGTKVSALTAIDAVADEDLVYVVDDPAGTPADRKATVAQLKAAVEPTQTEVMVFSQSDSATTGESGSRRVRWAGTITTTRLSCVGAPQGSALTVEVRVNGTAVDTLTIADGSTVADLNSTAEAVSQNDEIDVNATSVGSTTAATDVVVEVQVDQS